jgi:hypothetical protein
MEEMLLRLMELLPAPVNYIIILQSLTAFW